METGSNKQTASKACALSLVRQLFHLQVIEPFTGIKKKNKDEEVSIAASQAARDVIRLISYKCVINYVTNYVTTSYIV